MNENPQDTANKNLLMEAIPVMEGWSPVARAILMYDFVRQIQPETIVEIGVFAGRSLLAMALALKVNGHGTIFGIDPWKVDDAVEGESEANRKWWGNNVDLHLMHRQTMECIWKHQLDQQAVIIRVASQNLPRLFPGGIDLLNLDGNHSELASCRDVELYLPQLNHNGYVMMDDCDWPTTVKAQALIEKECDLYQQGENGHYKWYCHRLKSKEYDKVPSWQMIT